MAAHRLEIVDLSCSRGDRPLFVGLSVQVHAGELLHVAGSNGSGKTTLLRTLCGLSRPAEGIIRWRGTSLYELGDEYRQDLSYLGHKDGINGELTPPENLKALACGAGISNDAVEQALERLGIAAYRSFPAKILSQGQKRRLALARLLVAAKPLWVLDEPFTALDVASCRLISDMLSQHLQSGGIVVLSSHQTFELPNATVRRVDLDDINTTKKRNTNAMRRIASQHYSA